MTQTRDVLTQDDLRGEEQSAVNETLGTAAPREKKTKKWSRKTTTGKRAADARKRERSVHESRAREVRAADVVHEKADEPWVRPSTLPYIPARPGYVQRWVRVAIGVNADALNVSSKFREGWKPRKAETLAEDFAVPRIEHGQYAGCIGVGGNVLCEMPEERNKQRNEFYRQRNARQTQAVRTDLAQLNQQGHPGFGPIKMAQKSLIVREVNAAPEESEE
jgi:hypothetical protein